MECPTCGQPCSSNVPEGISDAAADIRAIFKDRGVHITKTQAKIVFILRGKNRPISRNLMMEMLYGFRASGDYPMEKTVDVIICQVRKKIRQAKLPWELKTVWGFGYELEEKKSRRTMKAVAGALAVTLLLAHPVIARLVEL